MNTSTIAKTAAPALLLFAWLLLPHPAQCFYNAEMVAHAGLRALGTPSATSAPTRYGYDHSGEVIRDTGPTAKANPFRFSAKYRGDETDLLYYGYRYYNASTGRWLSRDPLEEQGSLNLYGFAKNDCVRNFDRDGRELGLWYCPFCGAVNPPTATLCTVCGQTPPDNGMLDAVLEGALVLCVPVSEADILATVAWRVGGKCLSLLPKIGSACCKAVSKLFRARGKVDPNKLHHIFDNPRHNLSDVLNAFGGDQSEAYRAMQEATEAARSGCGPGTFQIKITIKGKTITVRGTVAQDGQTHIGTVFQ
jgi:RHS repeat-associated protein